MNNRMLVATLVAAGMLAACGREAPGGDRQTGDMTAEEIQQARPNWSPALSALIDSGNAAYAAQAFAQASNLYRRAAQLDPDVSAAWFGIYMAEHARGNVAAADSAMARARQLSPGATPNPDTPTDTQLR